MSIKNRYKIVEITKKQAKELVSKYHYLGEKDFMFIVAYGIIDSETGELLGCATYGRITGIVATKGWFGLSNSKEDSNGLFELTRLVMNPKLNGKNFTSYLLGNSLRKLKQDKNARGVITLADTDLHIGYVYQSCNFNYYGITDYKTDFYAEFDNEQGFKLNPRGKTKDKNGVWLPRTRKHRYAILYDNDLKVQYEQKPYPKGKNEKNKDCCNGCKTVFDKRFGITYSCPRCTGELKIIKEVKKTS